MRYPIGNARVLRIAIAAAGAFIVNVPVTATQAEDEVIVESAPSTLIHRIPYTGGQMVSITRRVSYSDLDLVTHAGVQTLEARINETAGSLCDDLGRRYGLDGFDRPQCVRDAVRGAMAQARTAIAAAERKMRTAGIETRK
jgi:UrcA family protein